MNKEIVLIELFAGTGGFAVGLTNAGFVINHHYFSEIDINAIANFKYNFPDAEYIGSVTDVCGRSIRTKHPNAKIIVTFGWPCQDNSIAGKRKGQRKGTRSGLLVEGGRICYESKCDAFIAENVKGLFSVNEGLDFYTAIDFLTYIDTDSPQYTVEMQLLNTSWLLPQNRERAYFVGHRFGQSNKRIFPIFEGDIKLKVSQDYEYETMYTLSKEFINEIFREGQENERWQEKFLQGMLKRIFQKIQTGEFVEHKKEPDELRQITEGNLQETKILMEDTSGRDFNGELYRVVQLPTEEMLLLWIKGGTTSVNFRFLQPEDLSFDCGQNGFKERISTGQHGSLLFSVQSYQGRLFYSIGDGKNWENVYSKKMGKICSKVTLSHILEQDVDQSYFLSQKTIAGLLKGQSTPQLLEP